MVNRQTLSDNEHNKDYSMQTESFPFESNIWSILFIIYTWFRFLRILCVKQLFKKQILKKDSEETYDDTLHKYLLIIEFPKYYGNINIYRIYSTFGFQQWGL
jgi:hypothetical protein